MFKTCFLFKLKVFFILLLLSNACAAHPTHASISMFPAHKQLVGNIEKIALMDPNIMLNAKLDTGAKVASLSAINIQIYHVGKKLWVRWELNLPSAQEKIILNRPLVRYMLIQKRKDEITSTPRTSANYTVRPVIELPVCIGKHVKTIEVNLVDRSNFRYAMLLGTDVLKQFNLIVDVEKSYLLAPRCY